MMESTGEREFDKRDILINERALSKLPRLVPMIFRSLRDECLSSAALFKPRRYPDPSHRGPIVREMVIAGESAGAIRARLFILGYRGADLNFPPMAKLQEMIKPYQAWRDEMLRDNQVEANG